MGGIPQENETDTTNGLRLSKLRKLQIEGLGSMRRLSLKSTLFGVDPNIVANSCHQVAVAV